MRLAIPSFICVAAFGLDQASKWFILLDVMDPPRIVPLAPFFRLVLIHNRGVSFGLLDSEHPSAPYLISFLSLVVVIALGIWLWRTRSFMRSVGLAAVIGGALSNVVDRLWNGSVTDFLDFYVGSFHWPAFNVADASITCGVAVLLVETVWPRPRVDSDHPSAERSRRSL